MIFGDVLYWKKVEREYFQVNENINGFFKCFDQGEYSTVRSVPNLGKNNRKYYWSDKLIGASAIKYGANIMNKVAKSSTLEKSTYKRNWQKHFVRPLRTSMQVDPLFHSASADSKND